MWFGDFSEWTQMNILIRVLASVILGSVIGIDRGLKHKGAGTKTNTAVCLGATLVMLTEQFVQVKYPGLANMTRMSAQVISGVGFLGVGTIIVSDHKVKGLTTAAMLWTCACIGLATGAGFVDGALLVTAVLIIAMHALPYLEHFATKNSHYYNLYFDVDSPKAVHRVVAVLKNSDFAVEDMEVYAPKLKEGATTVFMTLHGKKIIKNEQLHEIIAGVDEVIESSIDII